MTQIDRAAIYERDHGICGFCGETVQFEVMHLDHFPIPKGLGGLTVPENLRVSHRRCNIAAGHAVAMERMARGLSPLGAATLRFPAELHDALSRYAKEHGRPFSAQVLYWLQNDLEMAQHGEHPKP